MNSSLKLPDDFIVGVGDADLQVVGEDIARAHEGSMQSMTDFYARTTPGMTPPGIAIDRYTRYKEDVALMKELGFRHYRCSVSMSRTLNADGTPNEKALAWYKNYFEELATAGIAIYVTLYHWELPQHLSEKGGWTNRDTCKWLVRHASLVQQRLGQYITEYFILNEPIGASMHAYAQALAAPGGSSLADGLLAAHHMLLAQGMVLQELVTRNPHVKVSTVVNRSPFYPYTDTADDKQAAQFASAYFNDWFLDPVYWGTYPAALVKFYGAAMPDFPASDMDIIRIGSALHSLGINYYFGNYVIADATDPFGYREVMPGNATTTGLNWNVTIPPAYPEGLRDMLQTVHQRYRSAGLQRIYITENGMACKTIWDEISTLVEDPERVAFLHNHLGQTLKARQDGVPVVGYFVWTLMDNFEWTSNAYLPQAAFGLIHIERDDKLRRILKQSALFMQDINQQRFVPPLPE